MEAYIDPPKFGEPLVPAQLEDTAVNIKPTLTQLVERSASTLDRILQDETVSSTERADIALRIVALASGRDLPASATLATAERTATAQLTAAASAPQLQSPQLVSPDPYSVFPPFLPARCLKIDNFLSPEENQQLLQMAIAREADYVSSTTSTNEDQYRASSVLYPNFFEDVYFQVSARLRRMFADALNALHLPIFTIDELEMQLTAHGDGNYYKVHNDSDGDVGKRTLTYVYYFNREPKPYRGGNLRMYDTEYANGWRATDNFRDIEPKNNRIVLFDSRCMHEVLPVESNSTDFGDSRFTLNGWLRRP